MQSRRGAQWLLGVVLPLALVVIILTADYLEGPKTAYVGVLAAVPMLSAVFARPLVTLAVGVITWLAALGFGLAASDGNVPAQRVRLVIIALAVAAAVGASLLRERRDSALIEAQREAALADQLRTQADTDSLTGLLNRRGVFHALESSDPDVTRTLAIIDCDGLKAVNDDYGHLAGDEYLCAIAGRVRANLPGSDVLARWGGDEFLVVQDLEVDSALRTLERVRRAISDNPIGIRAGSISTSVSIGVVGWHVGQPLDEALAQADRALYRAKADGGDVVLLGDL